MATNFAITGNTEILQVADAVAREKGIPREAIISALKEAIATVSKRKYGQDHNIRVEINEKTGEIEIFMDRTVVDQVSDIGIEISLEDAKEREKNIKEGDIISDSLPPIDFGRVTSQTVKQVVIQKIKESEREKQYEDFKDRIGEIITGVVKRVEYGNVIIDFGKTETLLPRDQVIPREMFRTGDRVRAYISEVKQENKGHQVILSRTKPDFLTQLFSQEVPEIYDNIITIKSVARDPGSRAKCAVVSNDSAIDPVGACIGPRGVRVTAVYNELQGEKIDIIQWSPDLATFAVNAITSKSKDATVEVSKIVIDEDRGVIEAIVPDDQLSLAIGRRGQNVRLASELVGWTINVISEADESARSVEEFNKYSEYFANSLNVEEVIGQLLASEGFKSMEEIAYIEIEELTDIEGFDEDLATELQNRAVDFIDAERKSKREFWESEGVDKKLLELPYINEALMFEFASNSIKTIDDVADLSRDDFRELFPKFKISDDELNELIMKSREHWFDDNKEEAEAVS